MSRCQFSWLFPGLDYACLTSKTILSLYKHSQLSYSTPVLVPVNFKLNKHRMSRKWYFCVSMCLHYQFSNQIDKRDSENWNTTWPLEKWLVWKKWIDHLRFFPDQALANHGPIWISSLINIHISEDLREVSLPIAAKSPLFLWLKAKKSNHLVLITDAISLMGNWVVIIFSRRAHFFLFPSNMTLLIPIWCGL